MYKITFSKQSYNFYVSSQSSIRKKIDKSLDILKTNPYQHNNIKSLSGSYKGYYRYRAGDYRIIYQVIEGDKIVVIILVEHRSKVYKK